MNDLARNRLVEIIRAQGIAVCNQQKRLRGLLNDYCPGCKREVSLILCAVEEQVPANIQSTPDGFPWESLAGRLSKRLAEDRGINDQAARWAVDCWGLALGRTSIDAVEPGPVDLDKAPVRDTVVRKTSQTDRVRTPVIPTPPSGEAIERNSHGTVILFLVSFAVVAVLFGLVIASMTPDPATPTDPPGPSGEHKTARVPIPDAKPDPPAPPPNRAPTLTDARFDSTDLKAGDTVRVRLTGTDEDQDPLTYEYRITPSGAWQVASGDLVTFPNAPAGSLRFEFRVKDDRGAVSAVLERTCFIRQPNRAPSSVEISRLEPAVPEEGKNLVVHLKGTDPDGDTLTFQYRMNYGTWLTAYNAKATLGPLKPGLVNLEYKAIDPQGLVSSIGFRSWTVSASWVFGFFNVLSKNAAFDRLKTDCYAQVFRWKMYPGQTYTIDMASKDFDAFLRLEDSNGTELMRDDDGGGNLNARMVFSPTREDNYKIIATSFAAGGTGWYGLTIGARGGTPKWTFTDNLTSNSPVGRVGQNKHYKIFLFRMVPGTTYTIDMTSTDFDTYLRLEDAQGNTLVNDDDGGGNLNARIVYTPTREELYGIVATSYRDGATGSYKLEIKK